MNFMETADSSLDRGFIVDQYVSPVSPDAPTFNNQSVRIIKSDQYESDAKAIASVTINFSDSCVTDDDNFGTEHSYSELGSETNENNIEYENNMINAYLNDQPENFNYIKTLALIFCPGIILIVLVMTLVEIYSKNKY